MKWKARECIEEGDSMLGKSLGNPIRYGAVRGVLIAMVLLMGVSAVGVALPS
jgi:hypothetical protein